MDLVAQVNKLVAEIKKVDKEMSLEIVIAMLEKLIKIEKAGENREDILHALDYQLREITSEMCSDQKEARGEVT